MFSVIGKVKTNHIPSYASVHQTDWAKQNYILKFSLSLAIISGEKLRSQGGGTLLPIQLFSAATLPLLPTKCLEQILPHVPKELLRATQAFWALGRWISDGGGSNVILCKCSFCCPFSVALPRTVLLSCSFPLPPLPGNDGWIYTDTCMSCLCTILSSYHCVSEFPSGSEIN